jgi:hypothetical protein
MTNPMADFSPSDAAFEGFRITREHPGVIPVWSLIQVGIAAALLWAMASSGYLAAVEALGKTPGATPDMAPLVAVTEAMFRKLLPVLPFVLVGYALLQAAVSRMVLRPQQRSLGYIRVGADEFRVLVAQLLVSLITAGFLIGGLAVFSIVAAIGGIAGGLLLIPLLIAFCGGFIVLAVRLSLAAPATFATGKIAIGLSWTMTKGRFWQVFGANAIAFALYAVMVVIASLLSQSLQSVLDGAAATSDLTSFKAMLTPGQILSQVLMAVITALGTAILYAPGAYIYRVVAQDRSDVF